MRKKEIPSQDPELGPDETPVSPEIEWLAKELEGGLDPKALQGLKGVEVTFAEPEPGLATKKGKRVPPAVTPASPDKVAEVLVRDMSADRRALEMELVKNTALWQSLKEAAGGTDPNSFTGKDISKKMLLLTQNAQTIQLGIEAIDQICIGLEGVPQNDPGGTKLYSLGAWISSEALKGTLLAVYSEEKSAAQRLNLRLEKLLLDFTNEYIAYENRRQL
jgi:hypothetical protein